MKFQFNILLAMIFFLPGFANANLNNGLQEKGEFGGFDRFSRNASLVEFHATHTELYFNDSIINLEDLNNPRTSERLYLKTYFTNYAVIPYYAAKEVVRTDQQGLDRNIFVLSVLAATFTLDHSIRDFVQGKLYTGSNTLTSRFLYNVGCKEYFLQGFAGLYGLSLVTRNRYFHDTMLLSFQSLIVTQGFTELFKNSGQRVRPRNSPDNPFAREKGAKSFISGHASGIWAVMTVVAVRYPKLKYGAYGLAAAVSVARVYEDAHWTSDILMGAIVGYGVGQLSLKLNESVEHKLIVAPFFDKKANGASVIYRF